MAVNAFAAMLAAKKAAASAQAETKQVVLESLAEVKKQDEFAEQHTTPDTIPVLEIEGGLQFSKLIDNDFPFDESQLYAINHMVCERYACLTGAAGTGKTTSLKKLIDELLSSTIMNAVDMNQYFKKGAAAKQDDADDYEMPEKLIPSVALVSFTGKATQQIKRNFPRDWHGNIMTIHRLLAFVPEYYEAWDEDAQEHKNKMRFVPTYNQDLKLPWDIIVIDEAGMTGLDLWHQLWAACKEGCRIYMVGDINQLPPVHGRSIFGFAMTNWPSFELTHIHRQQGKNNPIVDNAWRVLKGEMPKTEGKFQMIELPGDSATASRKIRAIVPQLVARGIYEPNRDTIITAINGLDGSRGQSLGQIPLNNEFSLIFNPKTKSTRYFIDAGRERKTFAVGDKVMATKNDHEAGITNGMTGIITDISQNGKYAGDFRRFGPVDVVNEWMRQEQEDADDGVEFTLEELGDHMEEVSQGIDDAKESRDRGPASHIVTVRFGDTEHGFELPFATLAEVGTLQTAYVVTCHKMQGGESPVIVIVCHNAHKAMLYREWLYTAITRASQMCILLYTPEALRTAISKQNIKGKTLREKVESFNALQKNNGLGAAVSVTIPFPERLFEPAEDQLPAIIESSEIVDAEYQDVATDIAIVEPEVTRLNEKPVEEPTPKPEVHVHTGDVHVHETHIHVHLPKGLASILKKAKRESVPQPREAFRTEPTPEITEQRGFLYGRHGSFLGRVTEPLALPAPEPETYEWHIPDAPYTPKMEPDSSTVCLRDSIESSRKRRSVSSEQNTQEPPPPGTEPIRVNPWLAKLKASKS